MSTVKISELSLITQLNANTSNTLFLAVDLPSGVTGKFTGHTLAQGLFSNEILNVGNNAIVYDNVIAQFSGNSGTYLQINNQNFDANGSTDYVASTNDSDNTNNYIDMGINGSSFSDPVYSSMKPYDGYVYSHGPAHIDHRGNLVIGTASTDANIVFIAGGTTSANIVGRIGKSVFDFLNPVRVTGTISTTGGIVFNDGTTQVTSSEGTVGYANSAFVQANAAFIKANTHAAVANSGALYANAAFIQANAAFLVANTPTHVANSAALYANSAFIEANSAYAKANAALANSSGTFAGDLTISGNTSSHVVNTGNLTVVGTATVSGNTNLSGVLNVTGAVNMNSTLVLSNTNFTATESAVTIKATANVATPSNDGYMLHISGKQNTASRIVFDSYSVTGNAYGLIAGRTARGTVDSPLAVANNDVLMRVSGNGHGGSGAGWTATGVARIDIVATENYSSTNRGSQIQFWNCAVGSNTLQQIASFNGDNIHFTGVVNPQKGFQYTPNNITTVATTYTVDFNRDSMVRMSVNDNMAITLQNYIYGKVVEVWITNSAAQNKTITHGCLANNSSSKQTTFTVQAQSCAYLKYFSIDGDQANTFVSITA